MEAKQQQPVTESSEQFAMKVHGHVMSSYIGIGIAFGDHLGLFEVLATLDEPKSAAEIATLAKLKER